MIEIKTKLRKWGNSFGIVVPLNKINKDWQFREDGKFSHENVWPGGDKKPDFLKKGKTLICERISYYSYIDEDMFFAWLEGISAVADIKGIRENLYINIKSDIIPDGDLKEFLALFHRYKVDMSQLKIFLNDQNKKWFFDDKDSYWHKRVFGNSK